MRIGTPFAILSLAAILAACGDDSRSPLPTQPGSINPSATASALTCDAPIVRSLITQLYASHASRNTPEGLLNKFKQGVGFMPNKRKPAWEKFLDIIEKVDGDFHAGHLPALTGPSTVARRNELFARLLVCAGYTVPQFNTDGDVIVGFIHHPELRYTFISTKGDFAVQTPPDMFSEPVVIIGSRMPDGFLVQSIYDEWPIKTEITANPPGKETGGGKKAIIKICQYESDFDDEADRSFVRIVRRHGISGAVGPHDVVTVLQFTTSGPFLICPENPPSTFIGSTSFFSRSLAAARQAMSGASTFAAGAFAPRELYAASSMVDGGVGGFVEEFLSFYAGATVPDLRIQSITVNPEDPNTNHEVSFDVVVENIGFGRSPPSTLRYSIVSSGAPATIVAQGDLSVEGIEGAERGEGEGSGPGEAFVTALLEGALDAGTYTITVTADFPNEVGELNETAPTPFDNNTATATFTVEDGGGIPFGAGLRDRPIGASAVKSATKPVVGGSSTTARAATKGRPR